MGELTIEGLKLTALREIADDRGGVLHMLRNDAIDFIGFGECYFSEVQPGAVKAWKKHTRQTQNISVPVGRMLFVIFDDREFSPTRGKINTIQLGRPDAYYRIQIPKGLWYGFTCIGTIKAMLVNCADIPHDPKESETLTIDNPPVAYDWTNFLK